MRDFLAFLSHLYVIFIKINQIKHLHENTNCTMFVSCVISTNVPVDMQIFLVYSIDCDIKYKADILGSPSQSSWWRQGNQQWHWVWDSLWTWPHVWHQQEHRDSLLQSHHRQGEWLCHLWNIYTRYTILFIVFSEHFVKVLLCQASQRQRWTGMASGARQSPLRSQSLSV